MTGNNTNQIIKLPKSSRIIRLNYDHVQHEKFMSDHESFKIFLDDQIAKHPELFPVDIVNGYTLNGKSRASAKLDNLQFRKIEITRTGDVFSVYPSFVMPNLTAYTVDVEKALLLRKHDVPYSTLVYIFGKDEMYWWRVENTFSKCSIVGTTIKNAEKLPEDIGVDEKHAKRKKEKIYIATTVAGNCVLGAEVATDAYAQSLTKAYSVFANECRNIDHNYAPKTVSIDGWDATKAAMNSIFTGIVIIYCFLHGFIKIRDRCRRSDQFDVICGKVWHVYQAVSKKSFAQRLRRLRDWANDNVHMPGTLSKIMALCDRSKLYQKAYDHPNGYRTSNAVDRSLKQLKKSIFTRQNYHGRIETTNCAVRSWAILHNFYPYCLKKMKSKDQYMSPSTEINGFYYSGNWLENLLISSSMNGYKQ